MIYRKESMYTADKVPLNCIDSFPLVFFFKKKKSHTHRTFIKKKEKKLQIHTFLLFFLFP
jgi:hypothetical protein